MSTKSRPDVLLAGKQQADGFPAYYLAQLSMSLATEFKGTVLEFLAEKKDLYEIRELVLIPYEAQYTPESHEVTWVKISEHEEVRRFLEGIPDPTEADVFDSSEDSLGELNFFSVSVFDGNKLIQFFRSFSPTKRLVSKQGILAKVQGRRFDKIEEASLVFERGYQVAVFDGFVFIFKQSGFERLFQFYAELASGAGETLAQIQDIVPIANFDEFRVDAMGHPYKLRKLRNISQSTYLSALQMRKLKETIREYALPIDVVEEGGVEKLRYDRDHPWAILQLLEDQFVKSPTTGKKYAANSKREISTSSAGRTS